MVCCGLQNSGNFNFCLSKLLLQKTLTRIKTSVTFQDKMTWLSFPSWRSPTSPFKKKGPCFGSRNSLGFLCQNTCLPDSDPEEAMEKIQRDKFQRSEVTRKGGGLPSLKLAASLRLKIGKGPQKETRKSSNHPFSGTYLLVSGRVTWRINSWHDRVKWLGLLPQSPPKWFSKQKYVPMKKKRFLDMWDMISWVVPLPSNSGKWVNEGLGWDSQT